MKDLSKSFCIKEGLKEFYLSREVEPMTDCYLEGFINEALDVEDDIIAFFDSIIK